jgi:multiple sugar transport system ATP-binding protein
MAAVILRNLLLGVDALNLEIGDREFVVLTGPVGCGNSTILLLIAGLEDARQGDIHLGERRLNDVSPKDRDVGLVAQDYAPYPDMSVDENLAFALKRKGFAETEIRKRVLAVAEILGLGEQLREKAHLLSRENRQLMALARAMVLQPKVFLFDNPFSTLGREAQMRGRAEIKKLHQRMPATMIYATDDPVEALALGERTVVLNQGSVQQDGPAQAVYDAPATLFVAGFVGSPPMNLVHGSLKQERDALVFSEAGDGTIAVRLTATRFTGGEAIIGKPIVLGIRPEDLDLAPSSTGAERSSSSFRALVDRVELRGGETDLHLRTGGHELICRSRRWVDQGDAGHRFQFEMNLEKAHLFDAVSGDRMMAEL